MSARLIAVLALVAYVTIPASSYPYGTRAGQQPVKGQQLQLSPQAQVPIEVLAQYEASPVKTHRLKSPPRPVYMAQQSVQQPVKGQTLFAQGQQSQALASEPQRETADQESLASAGQVQTSVVQADSFQPIKGLQQQPVWQQSKTLVNAPAQVGLPRSKSAQRPVYLAQPSFQRQAKGQTLFAQEPEIVSQLQTTVGQTESVKQPVKGHHQQLWQQPLSVSAQVEAAPVRAPYLKAPRPSYATQQFVQQPAKGQSLFAQGQQTLAQSPAVEQHHEAVIQEPLPSAQVQTSLSKQEAAPVNTTSNQQGVAAQLPSQ